MDTITYGGLDVHKATISVALAESGRGGEVRHIGVFENRSEVLVTLGARLKPGRSLSFCYEIGPCGSGELTPIWIPDAAHEAMRDLVRARATARKVLSKAR
jgi:transposase